MLMSVSHSLPFVSRALGFISKGLACLVHSI